MIQMLHVNELLGFITFHTDLAYIVILLVSFAESLALVGLIVPGTLIMFGIGAIVSTGSLDLVTVLPLAAAGAVAGDGVSYWLGHHYKKRLPHMWPFSRHPGLLKRGTAFFESHGGKSVFLGRFVGPVRAIIPVVAGMMGMEPVYFFVVNVLSAVGWSLFFILPGFFLGTSFAVAGSVSARLAILGFILLCGVWIFLWLGRKLACEISTKGSALFAVFMDWLASDVSVHGVFHPVKKFLSRLFLRRRKEELFTGFLIVIFFLTCWGFLGVLQDVINKDPLIFADHAVYNFFRSLRTPWADNFFVFITECGDFFVNICLFCAVLIVLAVKRCYRTAVFWILTVAGGFAGVQVLKYIIRLPRPITVYHGVPAFGFPSCHTTMGVIMYGFLVLMLTRDMNGTVRWRAFATILLISFAMSVSGLYLGVSWLSDVLGGFFIGTCWVVLAGIAWFKDSSEKIPEALLGTVIILVVIVAGGWHIAAGHHEKDIALYAPRRNILLMKSGTWFHGGWEKIPAWKFDIEGEKKQPLTIQFAGSLNDLAGYLGAKGWRRPVPVGLKNFFDIFLPGISMEKFPVLPRLHSGRFDCLRLIYYKAGSTTRRVLRMWPSDFKIVVDGKKNLPLFLGTVEVQRFHRVTGLMTAVIDTGNYDYSVVNLKDVLKKRFVVKTVIRPCGVLKGKRKTEKIRWHGMVLLVLH